MLLHRLARACYRRRWRVLAAWVLALVAVTALSRTAGGKNANNFSLPGTESQRAFDLLKANFRAESGDTADVVFVARGPGGVQARSIRERMGAALTLVRQVPHVSGINSPYTPAGARQISRDGTIAFAQVQFDVRFNNLPKHAGAELKNLVNSAARPGPDLEVEFGGNLFGSRTPPGNSELVGVLAAVVILLIAFGSLLAMVMPIFIALFGIFIGLALITLLAHVLQVFVFTDLIAAMIGIGVGIDYALFIVTRYRQGLHDGRTPEDAITVAVETSGRAVLFAGCTVVIALMGMFIMDLSFVNGLAVGSAFAVLITMIASVTLLPAMLGFCGRNIDKWHLPALHRSVSSAEVRAGFWFRWSRQIQRHPWPFAVAALAGLLVLAFPVTHLRLGFPDAGNDPKGTTTKKAYDLLSEGFGPGYNGPFLVAASFAPGAGTPVLDKLRTDLRAHPGVAAVSPVRYNRTDPGAATAAIIQVTPDWSPQDARTGSLVRSLRSHVIAPDVKGSAVTVHSGGGAALTVDLTKKLSGRLAWFFAAVIALSFVLLMAVFRSVLVPLKAAIMNLLSIGSAFGILVAAFQWGWGSGALKVSKSPIIAFSPMMLFAILFGLSMDYEVFLLSRVKEEHDRTGDNGLAVADGLAATARVITAAAAIMVCVFLTFVFQSDSTAKLFGLGLAAAILIDATVVRMVLVPATMELLGEANWWLPGWLERALPRLRVETVGASGPGPEPEPEAVLSGR